MDYKKVIESKYNREAWQELLYDIFRSQVIFKADPIIVSAESPLVTSSFQLGLINLNDGKKIAVYEILLSPTVDIEGNRVGIRNLMLSDWKEKGCSGAFMFCYRNNESVLRFSYVSEVMRIVNGRVQHDATDTKRFTYLLGEGHRCKTAIKQFEELKASKLCLEDITKAFSLESLNDRFFYEYREKYDSIVQFVTGKRIVKEGQEWVEKVVGDPCTPIVEAFQIFPDPEKAIRDYVKKLMGRIVFLQFIQKKGWLGVPAGMSWGKGDKEFLQHLFSECPDKNTFIGSSLGALFDDINTKRENDIATTIIGDSIRIPFLNGGLFERDAADYCHFELPVDLMQSLLSFFDAYNFTVDENSPDDEEFGVDPEMLGRIFESLLEDNKFKGAYYTPKDIVERLCKDALLNYLKTGFDDEEEKDLIAEFVEFKDASKLNILQRETISTMLRNVKVCDTAVGSGAFPMGMLHELAQCRIQLENLSKLSPSDIKKHIIERNLFGVDIEKGAVDIARLRLWLSLIIDEDTPHTLPNLEFKIIQGNSLMEIYDENAVDSSLTEISKLVRRLYSTNEHEEKDTLRREIDSGIRNYVLRANKLSRQVESIPIPNDIFTLWHVYFKEVFDKGGFDIVIGNPPYVESKHYIEKSPELAKYIKKAYPCSRTGKVDLCIPFIEMGVGILNNTGTLNYLIQRRFFMSEYGDLIREKIHRERLLKHVYEFSETNMFKGKTTYVAELLLQRGNRDDTITYCNSSDENTITLPYDCTDGTWNFKNYDQTESIIRRLKATYGTVGQLVDVKVGLQVLWKDAYHIVVDEIKDGLIYGHSRIDSNIIIEEKSCRAIVQNEAFPALKHYTCTLYAIFPYDVDKDLNVYRIPFSEYARRFPRAGQYLLQHKDLICSKVQTLPVLKEGFPPMEYWHLYTREQNIKTIEPKVVIPMSTIYPKATVILEEGIYCDNSNVNFVSFQGNSSRLYAFAGIVNSLIFRVMAKKSAIELSGGYSKYNKQYLAIVPIPVDKFRTGNPGIIRVAQIAQKIEGYNNAGDEQSVLVLLHQLNNEVKDLYELSDEEYLKLTQGHEEAAGI